MPLLVWVMAVCLALLGVALASLTSSGGAGIARDDSSSLRLPGIWAALEVPDQVLIGSEWRRLGSVFGLFLFGAVSVVHTDT